MKPISNNEFLNLMSYYNSPLLKQSRDQFLQNISNLGVAYLNQPYTFQNTKSRHRIQFPTMITENSSDHDKWLAARRRNFPSDKAKQDKEDNNNKKIEKGLISKLELRLREKIKIMNELNKKKRKKQITNEFERIRKSVEAKDTTKIVRASSTLKEKNDNDQEEGEILDVPNKEIKDQIDRVVLGRKRKKSQKETKKDNNNKATKTPNQKNVKLKYQFQYRSNNILDELYKKDLDRKGDILLQVFSFLDKEGYLNTEGKSDVE